jgi:asparagine synthase (glutamine-hydrolysing)
MCGIVGLIGDIGNEDLDWIARSTEKLSHRGPDATHIWLAPESNALLAHNRLSVIDTNSSSDQPFVSLDGDLVIVFNGEIYNYIELRDSLVKEGESFRTNGDTEVLLASYRRWGFDCLSRLNGMFAFAIWDKRRGVGHEQLFVARDRAGEKPFYYLNGGRSFEFASELKGLRTNRKFDFQGLNHYLALGYVPGDLCIAEGVKKLPPASAGLLDMQNGQFKIWQYWFLPENQTGSNKNVDGDELAEEAWSLLLESTRLRLRSDVPTGVFLSGGLDSSLVTAAATQVSDIPLKTFTIGVPGSSLDESVYAKQISDSFATDHYVLDIDKLSLEILDDFAQFIDEPIADSSVLPSYMVSRLTRQHVTVALGGDGGDELFGGYHHYQNILRSTKSLGHIPVSALNVVSRIAARLPAGIRGRNWLSSQRGGPAESGVWGSPYFDISLRRLLLNPDVVKQLKGGVELPEYRSLALLQNSDGLVDGLTRQDFQQLLPDDYLVKVDRASMANSLEVRTPFLDHNLVEFAFSRIPSDWKCTVNERRKLQNLMAKKYLPSKFEINRKQGFSIPMDDWLRNAQLDCLIELLPKDIFNVNYVKELITGHRRGRTNGARLFALLMLTHVAYG